MDDGITVDIIKFKGMSRRAVDQRGGGGGYLAAAIEKIGLRVATLSMDHGCDFCCPGQSGAMQDAAQPIKDGFFQMCYSSLRQALKCQLGAECSKGARGAFK